MSSSTQITARPAPRSRSTAGVGGREAGMSSGEELARDLHDLAINRLSQLTFELSAVSNLVKGDALERVTSVIGHLDDLADEVRWFVLEQRDRATSHDGRQSDVRELVEGAADRIGTVSLDVRGDLSRLPAQTAHQVRAVVAEAVHNAVTHSGGACLAVTLAVGDGELEVSVVDDGVGPPPLPAQGLGLGSMAARARQLGGEFTFGPGGAGGTTLTWRVPLGAT